MEKINRVWLAMTFVVMATLIIASGMLPVVEHDEGEWRVIWKGSFATAAENAPGAGASGWLSGFHLDYAETPGTCLLSNASTGAYDGWGNVTGYVSADDTATDLDSENGAYIVMRGRFNRTHCHDGSQFLDTRCRIYLTVSGDETITNVLGTRAVSRNNSAHNYIWINFYWDDGADGYRVLDDGNLAWNITMMAKF